MRQLLLGFGVLSVLCGTNGLCAAQNFDLAIDGTTFELELGKETPLSIGGRTAKVKLTKKPTGKFTDDFVSFAYPSSLEVTKKDLNDRTTQLLLASATGTLVIVQEYLGYDPASLTEVMIQTITKSDIAEGFTAERSDSAEKLSDGTEIKGQEVVTSRGIKKHHFRFFAIGNDIRGVFVITRIAEDELKSDGAILSTFWSTLTTRR